MRKEIPFAIVLCLLSTVCNNSKLGQGKRLFLTNEGITELTDALIEKFGSDAAYSAITLDYKAGRGTNLLVTAAENRDSKNLKQFICNRGKWKSTVSWDLELYGTSTPTDWLFTLQDLNLQIIPDLVVKTIDRFKNRFRTELNYKPDMVRVYIPYTRGGEGALAFTQVSIWLKATNEHPYFEYVYDVNGNFLGEGERFPEK